MASGEPRLGVRSPGAMSGGPRSPHPRRVESCSPGPPARRGAGWGWGGAGVIPGRRCKLLGGRWRRSQAEGGRGGPPGAPELGCAGCAVRARAGTAAPSGQGGERTSCGAVGQGKLPPGSAAWHQGLQGLEGLRLGSMALGADGWSVESGLVCAVLSACAFLHVCLAVHTRMFVFCGWPECGCVRLCVRVTVAAGMQGVRARVTSAAVDVWLRRHHTQVPSV